MRWRNGGHSRRAADFVKREGWREFGILVVTIDDERLNPAERESLRRIADKLYGGEPQGQLVSNSIS